MARYADRAAAGAVLARELVRYADADPVVLGLPRGGVPVAAPVAIALSAPLDVLIVRKLGLPNQPELAMGAVASIADALVVARNEVVMERAGVTEATFAALLQDEVRELRRRERSYRGSRPAVSVAGRTVVVVDDGLATGSTMRAAVAALRQQRPAAVVVATPVASRNAFAALTGKADEIVSVWTPYEFFSVGQAYDDFSATSEAEVRSLLDQS